MNNERSEQKLKDLYYKVYEATNHLRYTLDKADFKVYFLGAICYCFLSKSFTLAINKNEHEVGNPRFDYAELHDAEVVEDSLPKRLAKEIGYFIKPSDLFGNVLKRARKRREAGYYDDDVMTRWRARRQERAAGQPQEELNETLSRVLRQIEDSAKGSRAEKALKGLFRDFNVSAPELGDSVDERNETLLKILEAVDQIFDGEPIDAFADGFETALSKYLTANVKHAETPIYTPRGVAQLLARLAIQGRKKIRDAYDPSCGSGTLLVEVDRLLKEGVTTLSGGFFGEEANFGDYNLCRINMLLRGVEYERFEIANTDALRLPSAELDSRRPFDAILSALPYSEGWVGDEDATLADDERYTPAGELAPKSFPYLALAMHSLYYLAPKGVAALLLQPSSLYRAGKEQKIRQYLVDQNVVDAVIQLPSNLLLGTSLQASILLLRKDKTDKNILFVDASKEYEKVLRTSRLAREHILNIAELVDSRQYVENVSRLATRQEVEANGYSLAVPNYIERQYVCENVDINKLEKDIDVSLRRQVKLRDDINQIVKSIK